MKKFIPIILVFALCGCSTVQKIFSNNKKNITPTPTQLSTVAPETKLTLVNTNGVSYVNLSWAGTESVLIQGTTNLSIPNWFNVAEVLSTNQSYSVPITYSQEYFRLVGLTYITWAETATNYIGFRVFLGTNSGVYFTNYPTGTNQYITLTNYNANKVFYAVQAYNSTNNSPYSQEIIKTNNLIKLFIH